MVDGEYLPDHYIVAKAASWRNETYSQTEKLPWYIIYQAFSAQASEMQAIDEKETERLLIFLKIMAGKHA